MMNTTSALFLAVIALSLCTSSLAYPGRRDVSGDITQIAADLTDAFRELTNLVNTIEDDQVGRSRRNVPFQMLRTIHAPRSYSRRRRGRGRYYRRQRAGRNADISDH